MKKATLFLLAAIFAVGCEGKKPAEEAKPQQVAPAEKAEKAPAPEAAKPAEDPARQLVQQAIEARGGLEKLKAASAFSCRSSGVYMGQPYQAVSYYQPGQLRMDILDPSGAAVMSMMWGMEDCWNTMGPVVMPCDEQSRKEAMTMLVMGRALDLYPLLEPEWRLQLSSEGQPPAKVLQVTHKPSGVGGKLFFDDQNLVSRQVYQGSVMGQAGEFVVTMKSWSEQCGVKMPTESEGTFQGRPYVSEKVSEVTCSAPEAKVFEKPAQVADGLLLQKQSAPGVLACVTHRGPYDKMGETFGKLAGLLGEQKLMPMGAPVWTYLAGPPKVKDSKKFVTEICFPVSAPAPEKPAKKGELTIKAVAARPVLAIYGVGDYQKRSPEMMKLLMAEMKKLKLEEAGPLSQIGYFEPGKAPAEDMISEMQMPLKGKPKPKAKGK